MTDLPQPLTPAQRELRRWFADAARTAARAEREAQAVLAAMNLQHLKRGRRP
jgi:hypothetical protein